VKSFVCFKVSLEGKTRRFRKNITFGLSEEPLDRLRKRRVVLDARSVDRRSDKLRLLN